MRSTMGCAGLVLVVLLGATVARAQPAAPWIERPLPEGFRDLDALACADDGAYARSWQGQVARLTGDGWSALERVPGGDVGSNLVLDASGALFTTVRGGIARYADGHWSRADAPLGFTYVTQIAAFDDHAIVVGRGRVIGWDGTGYRAYDPGTWRDLNAVWGTGERDLWVAGGEGTALYFDGRGFTAHRIATEGSVRRLDGTSTRDVWAVVERPHGLFHWDGTAWADRTAGLEGPIMAARVVDVSVLVAGAFGLVRGTASDARWEVLHHEEVEPYAWSEFVDVCVTRDAIVLGGRRSTWTRPR